MKKKKLSNKQRNKQIRKILATPIDPPREPYLKWSGNRRAFDEHQAARGKEAATAKVRIERKGKIGRRKGDTYADRDKTLKEMGYASYQAYLFSEVWCNTKLRVFALKGNLCMLCGEIASEVHHNRYHVNDLKGKCLTFMFPICRGCHDSIEFCEVGKNTLHDAVQLFDHKRRQFLNR